MQRANFYFGLFVLAFGCGVIFVAPFQAASGERYGLPPAGLPMICGGLLCILAFLLIIQNLPRLWKKEDQGNIITAESLRKVGLYTVIAVIGVIVLQYVGFVAGGVVVIAMNMIAAGQRSLLVIGLSSVLAPVILFIILYYGLNFPLP